MDIELLHRPGNAAARIHLAPGETCTAEAGAMIAMSGDMRITTTTHTKGGGSIMRALKRSLAGASFFLNHFEPGAGGGELWLGTTLTGDMETMTLDQDSLVVQGGCFVACSEGVDIDLGWQGFKTLLSGEKLFWINLQGRGQVVVSTFGAIFPVQVDGEYIVDTGHIVAFSETLDFSITKAGTSWLNSFLSGEDLVCKFRGQGTVWCQSHNPVSFGQALRPGLRPRQE